MKSIEFIRGQGYWLASSAVNSAELSKPPCKRTSANPTTFAAAKPHSLKSINMLNRQFRTQLQPKQVVDLATNLRRKLTDLGIDFKPNTALDGVPVHLSDIYEISVAYQSFIDELVELPHTRRSQARLQQHHTYLPASRLPL